MMKPNTLIRFAVTPKMGMNNTPPAKLTGSFCSVFGNYLEYLPGRGQPGSTGASLLSVVCDQLVSRTSTLPPTTTSVTSSGVFVLDQGSRLLMWAGPESTDKARARGMAVCMTRRQRRGSTVAEVVLADQPGVGADAEFWEALGGRPRLLRMCDVDGCGAEVFMEFVPE